MRSDYIVPEAAESRRSQTNLKYAGLAGAFALAWVLAGQIEPPSSDSDAISAPTRGEIELVNSRFATPEPSPESHSSFLSDLTPISAAEASIQAPASDQTLDDLAELASEINSNTEIAEAHSPTGADERSSPATETSTTSATTAEEPKRIYKQVIVKNGDSLSSLFDRHDLKTADWLALAKLKGDARRLLRLQPGDTLKLELDENNRVQALRVRLNETSTLHVSRDDKGFTQSTTEDPVEAREVVVEGRIENSLFLSAKAAGLSDRLTMELTDIFAWDIDFALDIRNGDRFRVIYEDIYRDGEKIKEGNILAAEFINRGDSTRAVRYTDESGHSAYYTPEGQPMKKAFLRSPVDFTRISSRFSSGRKHPVLNKIRAHKGVDYAATRGTPIKSAGSGKVIFAGVKGGYGNVVIVQHAGKYKTLYAHLKNFRRGIRRGTSVNQGAVIGYVGSSGLATGPHLHYEFLINDRHVNPLTVKLPSAPRIAKQALPRFQTRTAALLGRLGSLLADNRNDAPSAG